MSVTPSVRMRSSAFELGECAVHLVLEGRPAERPQQAAAEIQRAHLQDAEPGFLESAERLRAQLPHRGPVHLVVEQREPRPAQRVEVATDRPRMHLPRRRQLRDRNARPRGVDLAQDLPLSNELGIPRHYAAILRAR